MARLAARLSMGLITEIHDLRLDSAGLGGVKRGPGGNQLVEVRSTSEVRLFTVRGLTVDGVQPGADHSEVETLDVEPDASFQGRVMRLEDQWEALERARTVVGVGKGVGRQELGRLEGLRSAVGGGEYAATRKVTDEGWLTHSRQVGITGRDIVPDLYIAVGISGSPNHMAAVSRAGTVLAINSDPEAPIFDVCDVGLVAPWQDVVDLLAAELTFPGGLQPHDSDQCPEHLVERANSV
jgi:electron transfer flavoprotein alpha subunit